MPRYDFRCDSCGRETEANIRPGDAPVCCGAPMLQAPHYHTVQVNVPASFHTTTEEVLGTDKAGVREMVRKGEIIPAGPGSRWV